MFTIALDKFSEYNFGNLHSYLLETGTSEFEIIIERSAVLKPEPDVENYIAIYEEFLTAAWAGCKLEKVSGSFGYRVPTVHSPEPFRFEIIVKDFTNFTVLLQLLIQVYDPGDKYDKQTDFLIEAGVYFKRYRDKPFIISSFGLLNVAELYYRRFFYGPNYIQN